MSGVTLTMSGITPTMSGVTPTMSGVTPGVPPAVVVEEVEDDDADSVPVAMQPATRVAADMPKLNVPHRIRQVIDHPPRSLEVRVPARRDAPPVARPRLRLRSRAKAPPTR